MLFRALLAVLRREAKLPSKTLGRPWAEAETGCWKLGDVTRYQLCYWVLTVDQEGCQEYRGKKLTRNPSKWDVRCWQVQRGKIMPESGIGSVKVEGATVCDVRLTL